MKQTLLSLLLLSSAIVFAQKKVECTKANITVDGSIIADYEGKGGIFSDRKIFIFSPNTKDTLIKILQNSKINLDHPMVDNPPLVYEAFFNNNEKTKVSFVNPPGWGFVKERKFLTILFNDNLPLLIENNKINNEAIKSFNDKNSFNVEKITKNINQIKDSIIAMKTATVKRDKKKPVTYVSLGKNILPKLYKVVENPHEYYTYRLMQDSVVIGVLEKEISNPTGSFAKCIYNFYKKVNPFKVGDITIEYLPISTTETSPGITAGTTSMPIDVKLVGLNTSLKAGTTVYKEAENLIKDVLISNGLL